MAITHAITYAHLPRDIYKRRNRYWPASRPSITASTTGAQLDLSAYLSINSRNGPNFAIIPASV